MKATTKTWLWIVASVCTAVAVPPLLLRAQPAEFSESLRDVNMMTQAERNGLERRYRDFLDLTEDERQKYREMHQRLLSDQTDGRGRLHSAMNDYYAWLPTLPQNQREELRETMDPAERGTLAAEFLEQQRARDAEAEMRAIMSDPSFRSRFSRFVHLTPEQLALVMQEVESSVTMTEGQRDRLDPPEGEPLADMARYLELFRIVKERGEGALSRMISAADVERIIAAVPNEGYRNWLSSPPQHNQRLKALLIYLVANLRIQLERERRNLRPTDSDLEQFVSQLEEADPSRFDELMQLEPQDFRRQVERLYAASQQQLDFRVISDALPPDMKQWPPRGRPGGRPPRRDDSSGRPRNGERPRPGDRRPGGPDRPLRDAPDR